MNYSISTRMRLISLWRQTSGSLTLEASMVLPWVMIIVFLVLLFALYVSQQAQLYYSASITAERAAFDWSNSAKDPRTGAYRPGQYDGLYWRLKDDALLLGWFGLATGDSSSVSVPIDSDASEAQGGSASEKLARMGASMPDSMFGEIRFRNIGIKRTVSVQARAAWLPAGLVEFRGQRQASANVSALVVEPTELIRTFDLIRYYSAKMKDSPQGATALRDKAASVLLKRQPR
ncbi:pilus assembly protein [Cohnella yongneupensis]|uniref:Pilus assembly protein n=1 Tax=Cohnella yongneupensis TaxID=425006 RepID=A0ABW0R4F0_9BACL